MTNDLPETSWLFQCDDEELRETYDRTKPGELYNVAGARSLFSYLWTGEQVRNWITEQIGYRGEANDKTK